MPFTLPAAKTQTMVLVFGFSSSFCVGFQGKVALVSGKRGFSFWFKFLPKRRGWGMSASWEYFYVMAGPEAQIYEMTPN